MRPDAATGSLDPKLAAATTAAPPPTVKMKGICKNFGAVRALQGVDLDLMPREILALVGDNAAGKSTLMKILSGALRADAGEMFIEGRPAPIHSPRDARNLGIEMVHQDFALCKNIWIAGNIYMGKEIRRRGIGGFLGLLDKPKMLRGSEEILRRQNVDIGNCRKLAGALSGGQQQSVAIARAVGFSAKVVIMDEPTASLGVKQSQRLLELTRNLPQQGISVIYITHRMQDVFTLCDRIMVLKTGQNVGTFKKSDVSIDEIVKLMILGRIGLEEGALPAA
jgi:ABC-type sugar transport system ATPase subunit